MVIKSVIIEPDSKTAGQLRELVKLYCPNVRISDPIEQSVPRGIEVIRSIKPELVFINLELEGGYAFDVLKSTSDLQYKVIFIVDPSVGPLMARAIQFFDNLYLRKPIQKEGLISIAHDLYDHKSDYRNNKRIRLPIRDGFHLCHVNQIIYIEGQGSYSIVHLDNEKPVLISKNLHYFETKLSDFQFLRVHKSYIVNNNKIVRFIRNDGLRIILINDQVIPVSKTKMEELFSHFID